jgi:enterochelin esterase-like enzyme
MKHVFVLILFCTSGLPAIKGQHAYADFTATVAGFYQAKEEKELDDVWNELVARKKIPLTCLDSVAFFFRGKATSVIWMGDFNGWGNDKKFNNKGKRIPKTDIWILKASLPRDARLDYKIFVDDKTWMLDPVNRATQWSGVGGGSLNSELRMPEWKEDSITTYAIPEAPAGRIETDILINSRELGYQVTYSIYKPFQYQKDKTYPVIYVTDGYEYMHEHMGNMVTVLNNLIHLGRIPPVMAVFIDHREPVNRSVNRRMQELGMNEKYLNFITGELIPAVEGGLTLNPSSRERAIIGTSIGGLAAAFFAFARPDVFGMAGIQSPAFWFKPGIYSYCERREIAPARIYLSTGLIHDSQDGAAKMKRIFEKNSRPHEFKAVNEGHSWGNWRALLDDMLVYMLH